MYAQLPYPPSDYHICPCCGTEFGNDDVDFTHQQLREMWIAGGSNWFFGKSPEHWIPWMQFLVAGLGMFVPQFFSDLRFRANATFEPTGVRNFAKRFVATTSA
jgi:hypothetical protein